MQLTIRHVTRYAFDRPSPYGLQQIRKTPKSTYGQQVLDWRTRIEGARKELEFTDYHRNLVELVSFTPGTTSVEIRSEGTVQLNDSQGVVGPHQGSVPLWLFLRQTDQTRPGKGCQAVVRELAEADEIAQLHELSARIHETVRYEIGQTESHWSAEEVLAAGRGVCQDHAHVFIACARLMGIPTRYVSGYLMVSDMIQQEAMHAWAEAHVDRLGWVGFDISNGISPDTRYVRVATGLDYAQAAPVTGLRFGDAAESMTTSLEVAQQ